MRAKIVDDFVEIQEDRRGDARAFSRGQSVTQAQAGRFVSDDLDFACAGWRIGRSGESLTRAAEFESETRLKFRLRLPAKSGRRLQDIARFLHGIPNAASTLSRYDQQTVHHFFTPARRNRAQAEAHPVQATDASGVAIGIPTGGSGDAQRALEIIAAEQQRRQHRRVVGLDRAGAVVDAVAVMLLQPDAHPPPIAFPRADSVHVIDQAAQLVVLDETVGRREQRVELRLLKCQRLQGTQVSGAIQRDAIVADGSGGADEGSRLFRVAGGHQGESVGKDLRADLCGERESIQGFTTALGRAVTRFEAQIGGVFGRAAEATPPEDRLVFDDGVQPGVAKISGADIAAKIIIGEGAKEAEGATQIVIGDDEGQAQIRVHEAIHLAKARLDVLIVPALYWPPEVDADDLAEDTGVNPLGHAIRSDFSHQGPPQRIRLPGNRLLRR